MKLTYPMIIHNDSDGIWAEFPDLPGCFTDGDNLTELMENASDAIRCHLTDYVKEEIKIPAASRLENVHLALQSQTRVSLWQQQTLTRTSSAAPSRRHSPSPHG